MSLSISRQNIHPVKMAGFFVAPSVGGSRRLKSGGSIPQLGDVLSGEVGDYAYVQHWEPQHQTQMKLFSKIAVAAIMGTVMIGTPTKSEYDRENVYIGDPYSYRQGWRTSFTYHPRTNVFTTGCMFSNCLDKEFRGEYKLISRSTKTFETLTFENSDKSTRMICNKEDFTADFYRCRQTPYRNDWR